MQHLEHIIPVKSVLFPNKKSECRIMEPNLEGDPKASNTNISISYWLIVHELLNSYNTAVPSFAQQTVLTGTEAHEQEISKEVN